eukprot:scaffold510_cov179-Ochromonas_danica.AAC.3
MSTKLLRAIFAEEEILTRCHCEKTLGSHPIVQLEGQLCALNLLPTVKESDSGKKEDSVSQVNTTSDTTTTTTLPPPPPTVTSPLRTTTTTTTSTTSTSSLCDILHHPSGWKFYSFHRHILDEEENKRFLHQVKQFLLLSYPSIGQSLQEKKKKTCEEWINNDHLHLDGYHLHFPPMLFGADVMLLQCPNGEDYLNISAMDALIPWIAQHTMEYQTWKILNIPKVPFSHGWLASMRTHLEESRLQQGISLTRSLSNSSTSSTHSSSSSSNGCHVAKLSPPEPMILPDEEAIVNAVKAHDWTYSSDYCLSLLSTEHSMEKQEEEEEGDHHLLYKTILSARDLQQSSLHDALSVLKIQPALGSMEAVPPPPTAPDSEGGYQPAWQVSNVSSMEEEEEDDLEDCGETFFEAKIRVMPTCWFLLTRLFVRVDQKLVRSRETRLFHAFPLSVQAPLDTSSATSPKMEDEELRIEMEVVWRELNIEPTVDPLKAGGGGGSSTSFIMKSYTKDSVGSLPSVNEKEDIHQFYTLVNTRKKRKSCCSGKKE